MTLAFDFKFDFDRQGTGRGFNVLRISSSPPPSLTRLPRASLFGRSLPWSPSPSCLSSLSSSPLICLCYPYVIPSNPSFFLRSGGVKRFFFHSLVSSLLVSFSTQKEQRREEEKRKKEEGRGRREEKSEVGREVKLKVQFLIT